MAVITILAIGFTANAQEVQKRISHQRMSVEKMDSLQCQRMVNELMLNDATVAKFTPLYMNYLTEIRNVWGRDRKVEKRNFGEKKEKTDAEILKSIEDRFAKGQKILDIRTKYYKEFKHFLTAKQVEKIYQPRKIGRFGRQGMGMPPFGQKMMGQRNMSQRKWFYRQKGKRSTGAAPLQKDSTKTNS